MASTAIEDVTVVPTEDDLVTTDHMDYSIGMWLIQRVLLPVICACGIMGILLTVTVLSRKTMCTSTNCYLMALALADLLFLLLLASTLADNQFSPHSPSFYLYTIYVTYAAIFMHIFLLASIWITVILALERFVAICRPFVANKVCTVSKARLVIITIFVLSLLCRLPNFWENRIVTVYNTTTNSSLSYMQVSNLSINAHYTSLYPWIIEGMITSIVPFLLLLLLNVRLIWAVRRSTRYVQRNSIISRSGSFKAKRVTSVVEKEERQVTVMLISVIIVFFLCQAPYVIYTALVSIRQFAAPSGGLMLFRYITMLLLTLKSAVNFVLYCWFSEKFRTTLRHILYIRYCLNCNSKNDFHNNSYYHLRRISSLPTSTKDTLI